MRPSHQITVDFDVPTKLSDGTILRANIYRPLGEGKWPVLLTRLPYSKDVPGSNLLLDPLRAARNGYVVVVQDVRGRFASGGTWEPIRHEIEDGLETVEWAAKLHYSNGVVGMYGASYYGFTQLAAAIKSPTALKALIPIMTWSNPFHGLTFRGGATELGTFSNWLLQTGITEVLRRHQGQADPLALGRDIHAIVQTMDTLAHKGYYSLPLKDFAPIKQHGLDQTLNELIEKPLDADASAFMTIEGKHDGIQAPALNISGWYDIFLKGTIDNFVALQNSENPDAQKSRLIIGPWSHGMFGQAVGESTFGFRADGSFIDLQFDLISLQLRWFDHWLKNTENGVEHEAPIKLFVMGKNVWHNEQEWPLARAVPTHYYLHNSDKANTLHGDGMLSVIAPTEEASDQYTYDPANPVLTRGGALLLPAEFPAGPYDQRQTESREDVLVYTSEPLEEDLEVTGPIEVRLWASSSAPDTDFVARLVDVHPDGYACNLTDGIVRARYRSGNTPEMLEPEKIYAFTIDLWATSNVFLKGHSIRVDITSSNFPRWDRNPNTGADLGSNDELQLAQQTIFHDAEHPSSIILPIVPGPTA